MSIFKKRLSTYWLAYDKQRHYFFVEDDHDFDFRSYPSTKPIITTFFLTKFVLKGLINFIQATLLTLPTIAMLMALYDTEETHALKKLWYEKIAMTLVLSTMCIVASVAIVHQIIVKLGTIFSSGIDKSEDTYFHNS